jgi:predicted nucleic acid-binding protein
MPASLFDTSIYVASSRRGEAATFGVRADDSESEVWLSSVVLEELYAGASDRNRNAVERLESDFDRIGRILVPTLDDWAQAGRVLARLAARYDYEAIGRGRLTNDALIATSAGRRGIVIITTNARDFRKLAEFHPFQWQLETL